MEFGTVDEETQGLLTPEKNAVQIETDRTQKDSASVKGRESFSEYGAIQKDVQVTNRIHRPPQLDRKSSRHIRVSTVGAFRHPHGL